MRPDCSYTLNGKKLTFQEFRQAVLTDPALVEKYVKGGRENAPAPVAFVPEVDPIDTEYFAALERGDEAAAARVVEEAARKAGYVAGNQTSKKDAQSWDVTKSDLERRKRIAEQNAKAAEAALTNAATSAIRAVAEKSLERNRKNAESLQQQIDAGAPIKEVFHATGSDWTVYQRKAGGRAIWASDSLETSSSYGSKVKRLFMQMKNPLVVDAEGATFRDLSFEGERLDADDLANIAEERGYDGLIIRNFFDSNDDGGGEFIGDHFAVFSPNQIKSADTITRDDKGNIIPPSQRFNTDSNDIRYSPIQSDEISPLAAAIMASAQVPYDSTDVAPFPDRPDTEPRPSEAFRQGRLGKDVSPEVKAMLDGRDMPGNSAFEDFPVAQQFLSDRMKEGMDIATAAFFSTNDQFRNELTQRQIGAIKATASRRLDAAYQQLTKEIASGKADAAMAVVAEKMREQAVALDKDAAELLSAAGSLLNFGKSLNLQMNPDALVFTNYTHPITRKQVEVIEGNKDGKRIVRTLAGAKTEAGEKAKGSTKDLMSDIAKVAASKKGLDAQVIDRIVRLFAERENLDEQQVQQVVNDVADSETERALEALKPLVEVEPDVYETLRKEVRKATKARIDRELADYGPSLPPGEPPTLQQQVKKFKELYDRNILAQVAFEKAVADLRAKGDPVLNAKLEGAEFNVTDDKGMHQLVKKMVRFREEIFKPFKDRLATAERMAALVFDVIDDPELAREIASALTTVYDQELQAAQQRAIKALIKSGGKVAEIIDRTTSEKLLRAVNSGLLSEEITYNILAPRFGLPAWDSDIAADIRSAFERVQNLEEDSLQRMEGMTLIMAEIAKAHRAAAKGLEKYSHISNVASSVWTAGILSGVPTHLTNTTATGASIFLEHLMQSTGNFIAAKRAGASTSDALKFYGDFGRALSSAFSKAENASDSKVMLELKSGLKHGMTRFRSEKGDSLSVLESFRWVKNPTTLKEAFTNYLSLFKFVGRAMAAADAANSIVSNDAALLSRARYNAMMSGLQGEELEAFMQKQLDKTGEVRAKAIAQAEKEAAEGQFDFEVSIKGVASSPKMAKQLAMARRVEQIIEREIFDKGDIEYARQFAARATFNAPMEGAIGVVGETIAEINSKLGVSRLIFPFVGTLVGLTNQAINYTPYAFLRARNFSLAGIMASRYAPESARGRDFQKFLHAKIEEGSAEYHAMQARGVTGTAVLAMLIGLLMKSFDDKDKGKEPFFMVSAAGPADFAQRKQLQAAGWVPNSIKIGGAYFRWTDWPGLSMILAMVGSYADARMYNKLDDKQVGERLVLATLGIANSIVDRSILSGASNLFKAVGGGQGAVSASKNLVSSAVGGFTNPSALRWIRASFVGDVPETTTTRGWLLSMTPAAFANNRPSLNVLGEPIKNLPWEPTTKRYVSLTEIIAPDPVIVPLTKAGLFIPVARNTEITDPKTMQPRAMTSEEYYDYSATFAKTVGKMLTPALAESLTKLNREAAQDFLDNTIRTAARNTAKTKIMRQWVGATK